MHVYATYTSKTPPPHPLSHYTPTPIHKCYTRVHTNTTPKRKTHAYRCVNTHTHTHPNRNTRARAHTHSNTVSISLSLSHTHTHTSLSLSLSLSHTHTQTSLSLSLTHTHTNTHNLSLLLFLSFCLSVCLSVCLSLSLSHTHSLCVPYLSTTTQGTISSSADCVPMHTLCEATGDTSSDTSHFRPTELLEPT